MAAVRDTTVVSARVPTALAAAWRAAAEGAGVAFSVWLSGMVERGRLVPAAARPGSVADFNPPPSVALPAAGTSRKGSKRSTVGKQRTEACEHRVPPGSYCGKGCDDKPKG